MNEELIDKRFSKVTAIFKPHPDYKHTMRKSLLSLEGEKAEFRYIWHMDENDSFPNVWALETEDKRWLGLWIPEFDLEIITES